MGWYIAYIMYMSIMYYVNFFMNFKSRLDKCTANFKEQIAQSLLKKENCANQKNLENLSVALFSQAKKFELCTAEQNKKSECCKA